MDPEQSLDALVAPLRADVVSGAAVVARTAAEVIRRAAVRIRAGTVEELRWGLGEVAVRVLDAQPAMAPLVGLVRDVLAAVEDAETVEAGRHEAARAAGAFRAGLDARARDVAARAAEILPMGGTIGTVSCSSTVREAILAQPRPSDGRVICLESRPMQEGQILAAALAEQGVPVTYAVDSAAASVMAECDVVLLGADSIGDLGVVNKIGSMSLAEAAHRSDVPVYVVTDETKILPPRFPQHLEDDRPADEVWRAPRGIEVWNRYFEAVPLDLVTSVVTESGAMTPAQVAEMRSRLELPKSLRSWAEGRIAGAGGSS